MKINGRQVAMVIFVGDSVPMFAQEIDSSETIIELENGQESVQVKTNETVFVKNYISPGSKITCGGDFRLGDG